MDAFILSLPIGVRAIFAGGGGGYLRGLTGPHWISLFVKWAPCVKIVIIIIIIISPKNCRKLPQIFTKQSKEKLGSYDTTT